MTALGHFLRSRDGLDFEPSRIQRMENEARKGITPPEQNAIDRLLDSDSLCQALNHHPVHPLGSSGQLPVAIEKNLMTIMDRAHYYTRSAPRCGDDRYPLPLSLAFWSKMWREFLKDTGRDADDTRDRSTSFEKLCNLLLRARMEYVKTHGFPAERETMQAMGWFIGRLSCFLLECKRRQMNGDSVEYAESHRFLEFHMEKEELETLAQKYRNFFKVMPCEPPTEGN